MNSEHSPEPGRAEGSAGALVEKDGTASHAGSQLMHKRKHRKSNRDDDKESSAHTETTTSRVQSALSPECLDAPAPDPCLYVQAHEADVIRGPPAVSAHFLECQNPTTVVTTGNNTRSGLIRWGPPEHPGDADTVDIKQPLLWVDR